MSDLENVKGSDSGIYIIVNVLDCGAYIGQAKEFNKRSHSESLYKHTDNRELQSAYDKGKELVYFVVSYGNSQVFDKDTLNKYENLFMILMKEKKYCGFNLYNDIQPKHSDTAKLDLPENEEKRAIDSLNEDFRLRFGMTPEELRDASDEDRKKALEYYKERRKNNPQDFPVDKFFYIRDSIKQIFNNEPKEITGEISLKELYPELDELFVSKAGSYIGEDLDQILHKKIQCINDNRYCVWTIANNAVAINNIRERCQKHAEKNKKVYVLFNYTPSNKYANDNKHRHRRVEKDQFKLINSIFPGILDKLGFEQGKSGEYLLPARIEATNKSQKSSGAFIIKKMYLVKEELDDKEFKSQYQAIQYNTPQEIKGKKRSTFYLRRKKGDEGIKGIKDDAGQHSLHFLAELCEPYVIMLTYNMEDDNE